MRGPGLANYIFSRVGGGKSHLGCKGSPPPRSMGVKGAKGSKNPYLIGKDLYGKNLFLGIFYQLSNYLVEAKILMV